MELRNRNILIYIILIVLVALWILPVWTSMLLSTKSPEEYFRQTFYQILIDNFKEAMKTYKVHEHFFNSVIYSVLGAVIAIVFASMAGYSIVRLRPKFNFVLFLIIYSGTLFPFQMYLIPLYKMYNAIGLYNTRAGMILIYGALCIPFSLFVYRGFYLII